MIVYIHCSTNNRARTVYELFVSAVSQFGVPSRVRSDQGGENVRVAQEIRGSGRRSIITGSSTHNQRIERLWRDVHRCVGVLYYRLFYHLETLDLLQPTNEIHLYCLHYVYLHRINASLQGFQEAWNHHRIRTEHNQTPHQLFTVGSLRLHSSGLVAVDFFEDVGEEYGIHEDGIIPGVYDRVEIPENRLQLREDHLELLQQNVDRFSQSQNYAIEIYEETVAFISNIISQNQTLYY